MDPVVRNQNLVGLMLRAEKNKKTSVERERGRVLIKLEKSPSLMDTFIDNNCPLQSYIQT